MMTQVFILSEIMFAWVLWAKEHADERQDPAGLTTKTLYWSHDQAHLLQLSGADRCR